MNVYSMYVYTRTHTRTLTHAHTRTCSASTLLLGDRTRPLISPSTMRKDKGVHPSVFSPVYILFPEVRLSVHHLPLKPTGRAPLGADGGFVFRAPLERRQEKKEALFEEQPRPLGQRLPKGDGAQTVDDKTRDVGADKAAEDGAPLSKRESRKDARGKASHPGASAGVRPAVLGNLWG